MLLIILATYTLAASDDGVQPAADSSRKGQDAHVILAKMRESRDLLKSGSYRASGRVTTNRRSMGEQLPGSVTIFSAFDCDRAQLRFDRTQPVTRGFAGDRFTYQETIKYIRTSEFAVTWLSPWEHKNTRMETAVGVYPPTIKPPLGLSPIDVRSLGLCLWDDFKAGMSFEACCDIWENNTLINVVPEANGIYRLRLERAGRRSASVPQTLWVDENQGFSPVRLSYVVPASEPGEPEHVLSECHVRWKKEAGAWVPASLRFERRLRGHINDFYSLTFDWISVNKPPEPKLFTPDGLDVPAGTRVVDDRGGVPRKVR
jgi:hypothetical protein